MSGLDIFLVNGDSIDPDNLTQSQRDYLIENFPTIIPSIERQMEKVKDLNIQEIESNKPTMVAEYNSLMNDLENRKSTISSDRYTVEKQALEYKYGRYLTDTPTEEDLQELRIRGFAPTVGSAEGGPHGFVFMAVRDSEQTVTFTSGSETLTIDASRTATRSNLETDYAPSPDQSYPNQDSFDIQEDPDIGGYLVSSTTPGFILRHELTHSGGMPDETIADQMALDGILEAASHMQETGEDNKYWAVFTTPEGVTITQNVDNDITI